MALPRTKPISIPSPSSSSLSSSPRSHFRCSSDAGSDLSISIPIAADSAFALQATQDPFAAFQLQQTLTCCTAQDILSCSSSAHSRLVVLSESIGIEAAGERLAEADDGVETWVVLKSNDGRAQAATNGATKLQTSHCAGLLSLEDLSAFFATVFGPQHTKGAVSSARDGAHDLVSPPASPSTAASRFHLPQTAHQQDVDAQVETIRTRLSSKKPVTASLVSNLSRKNSLRHVSLESSLQDVLHELSQDQVSCLVVSDLQHGQDGAVCGILTPSDVVAFLIAEAENNTALASIFSSRLDVVSPSVLHQPATVISGDKSTVDALVRMQSEQLSVLAVTDALGGLISSISSREVSREILRSSSRKILTTPMSSLVKEIRSRHPQGTGGKDVHPAISVSNASTVGRAAALLLATEAAGGILVVDQPRVVMTPPLSCVSASPGRELPPFSLDADAMPLSRSVSFTPAPAQKHRRSSTQFWTTPRASFSETASEATTRAALPKFALGGSAYDTLAQRRSSLKPEQTLSSSVSSLSAKSVAPTMPAFLRTPSGPHTHRPRSLSLAQYTLDETNLSRQFGAQATLRSQGSWTPSTMSPGSSLSSAGSPSSPFGNTLVSGGFFGEVMQNGMPRRVVTMKTVLRCVLAAMATARQASEEAVQA